MFYTGFRQASYRVKEHRSDARERVPQPALQLHDGHGGRPRRRHKKAFPFLRTAHWVFWGSHLTIQQLAERFVLNCLIVRCDPNANCCLTPTRTAAVGVLIVRKAAGRMQKEEKLDCAKAGLSQPLKVFIHNQNLFAGKLAG
jgi:hypothetical protein